MTIVLIDARKDSLTVSWPAVKGASKYKLEYRTDEETDDDEFVLLSDKLTQTQARKRNLVPNTKYFFRVTGIISTSDQQQEEEDAVAADTAWVVHTDAFQTLSNDEENSMIAPKVSNAGSNQALHISWEKRQDAIEGYELQMRENLGGVEWKTIAPTLSGTEVNKKNLSSSNGYQFRVRPAVGNDSSSSIEIPFSQPSETVVPIGLSQGIKRFFNSLDDGTLLRSGQQRPVPLEDAFGGKEFVLLYASAHWCPPCRQYTPQLANWYRMNRKYAEIVFLSCDHDPNGFKNYFASSHPWMAVDFDDDARENLLGTIRVSGIPRLVVLSGKTGRIIEDNAVGKPLDVNRWRSLDR